MLKSELRCKSYKDSKWISFSSFYDDMNPPIVLDVEPRKLNMGTYNVERTMVRFAMTDVFVLSKLHFEPCHVPLKYRYPIKKDDDIRPIHLIEVSRHFSHFKARK